MKNLLIYFLREKRGFIQKEEKFDSYSSKWKIRFLWILKSIQNLYKEIVLLNSGFNLNRSNRLDLIRFPQNSFSPSSNPIEQVRILKILSQYLFMELSKRNIRAKLKFSQARCSSETSIEFQYQSAKIEEKRGGFFSRYFIRTLLTLLFKVSYLAISSLIF